MAVVHGYATLVADSDTAIAASVGTINLQALAEQELADMLRAGDYDGFIGGLSQLSGENDEPEMQVVRIDLPDSSLLTAAEFPLRVGAVLGTDQLQEAVAAWYSPPAYGDTRTNFAVSLLESTLCPARESARCASVRPERVRTA